MRTLSDLCSVGDMLDNVICSDESWLLVGETGSSSCTGGGMMNLMDPFGHLNGCHVMMRLRRRLDASAISTHLDA